MPPVLGPSTLMLTEILRSYMYFVTSASGYSINYFFPIILTDGLGFEYTTSLILTAVPYVSMRLYFHTCTFDMTVT